jgi:hypothetical protein
MEPLYERRVARQGPTVDQLATSSSALLTLEDNGILIEL